MSLVMPTHVARQVAKQRAQTAVASALPAPEPFAAKVTARVHDLDTPVPEGLPDPGLYRVILFPVCQRRVSRGNIIIPEQEVDLQDWTHPLWKVAKVGPFVFRGPAWNGFPEDLLDAERAKLRPGALYLVDPKQPRRFHYTGPGEGAPKILFIVVNDDQLWSHVDPAFVDGLEFRGLAL